MLLGLINMFISFKEEKVVYLISLCYVRFGQGNAHGGTAEQYKRTTELHVEHPFPCGLVRQLVKQRTVTVQSPIECSLDDVRQRCRVIRDMVAKSNDKVNKNAMMQLLQGSAVPQVSEYTPAYAYI